MSDTRRRRFRALVARNRQSIEGHTAFGLGIRIGYWPCLKAPYLQLALAFWRVDLWHGLPSYLHPDN